MGREPRDRPQEETRLMSKPTLREMLDFVWDTKVFLYYAKFSLPFAVLGGLFIFAYWLVTGEIPK